MIFDHVSVEFAQMTSKVSRRGATRIGVAMPIASS
jgi:hypothetical protein